MKNILIVAGALTVATSIGVSAYLVGKDSNLSFGRFKGNGEQNRTVMGKNSRRAGLQDKADLFGMEMTDLLALRNSGKTMEEIATEKGMTEDVFHQKVQEAAVSRWKSMGFSDQEIQTRLTQMKERQLTCDGTGMNRGMGFN